MQKIMISLTLSSLLFLSGCSEKKKESKPLEKQETQNQKISEKHPSTLEDTNKQPIEKPFKPSLEVNTTQEEISTQSLENLEADAFKAIQPRITEEMRKIPDCLEKAASKEEAFACSQTLRKLNKELAMAMGDFNNDMPQEYDEDFVWDEETKVNMIKEIEAGTQAMQEMQSCMEASKTPEELESCLKP